jgi:hypothetical protein
MFGTIPVLRSGTSRRIAPGKRCMQIINSNFKQPRRFVPAPPRELGF